MRAGIPRHAEPNPARSAGSALESFTGQAGSLVARSVGMFLTVHQQKAEPAAHSAAYMAPVPFGFDASSPSCARSGQGPIAPSACGVRRPNANPDHRDGAAPAAAARAARVRRRGKEARVQEAHTRMTTEHRSARRRIRQRRSIASVTASFDMAHRGLLKLVRRTPTTHAWAQGAVSWFTVSPRLPMP